MFIACLVAGLFPRQSKVARLVLLNKGKGEAPNSPSSYRSLCMLNTIGKVMESMLRARLRKAIEEGGGLSEEQHGFREGHSTIDTIRRVMDAITGRDAEEACGSQGRPPDNVGRKKRVQLCQVG